MSINGGPNEPSELGCSVDCERPLYRSRGSTRETLPVGTNSCHPTAGISFRVEERPGRCCVNLDEISWVRWDRYAREKRGKRRFVTTERRGQRIVDTRITEPEAIVEFGRIRRNWRETERERERCQDFRGERQRKYMEPISLDKLVRPARRGKSSERFWYSACETSARIRCSQRSYGGEATIEGRLFSPAMVFVRMHAANLPKDR